jgi:hypothetical protein
MLNPDFREFIQLLNANKVRYLVVGGYAVAYFGYPRYTKDIDIWLRLERENAELIVRVLQQFGFGSLGLTVEDFLASNQIIQLGYPPARIDLLTTLPGVEFDECYAARHDVEVDGVVVHFIDRPHLIQNKRASGRLQDLADIEQLE